MTAVAGTQTFKFNPAAYAVASVTVNGVAATYAVANGVVTISAPTFAGGEAILVVESAVPPMIPAPEPFPIVATTSTTLTRNGVAQTLAGTADVRGGAPSFGVTGTTKTNS